MHILDIQHSVHMYPPELCAHNYLLTSAAEPAINEHFGSCIMLLGGA